MLSTNINTSTSIGVGTSTPTDTTTNNVFTSTNPTTANTSSCKTIDGDYDQWCDHDF